jgi:HK97 family phage major capsid protein
MSEYIEREFEAYRKDDLEARTILDTAAAENRSTTAEEDERFDTLVTSAQAHKVRADKLVTMDADNAAITEQLRNRVGDQSDTASGMAEGQGGRDSGLLSVVRSTLGIIRNGGEMTGAMNLDLPFNLEAPELRVITDFGMGTSLYASDFQTRVAVYQRTMSPWLAHGTIINANNGRPLIIPTSTADPTTYTPGEGTAISPADPTLGTVTATPAGYKALGYISQEAEEDEVVGLLQVISYQQGRALGLAFGAVVTAAVLSGGTNGGTAAGTGGDGTAVLSFFGYEDLLDLKYGAAAPYRMVGAWVASNGAIVKIRKFKDANKEYYWQPAIAAGQPATFDGDPMYEDPGLVTPGSATKSIVYGDLSQVVIKQMPLRVAVSTEYAFNLDNVSIKSVYRAGAVVADAAAIRYLVSKTT